MIVYKDKNSCCGCYGCYNACPKSAISMEKDEYGFIYPKVNNEKCVECGICENVCPYNNQIDANKPIEVYAALTKDEWVLKSASSGGLFSEIAIKVLEENAVVFGSALEVENNEIVVKHISIKNVNELYKLQGSKYVQSSIGNTYKEAKKYLEENKTVLFSGTPCQIDGLKKYLSKDYDNLITVDLICHGVPSIKFFNDYIKYNFVDKEILDFKFRDKEIGGGMKASLTYKCHSKVKKIKIPARISSYFRFFLKAFTYRENCYSCLYAKSERISDITLGDFWGIGEEHTDFSIGNNISEETGISCVLCNSKKGIDFINKIDNRVKIIKSDFDAVARHNEQLKCPSKITETRTEIMEIYKNGGYGKVEDFFVRHNKKQIMLYKIYRFFPKRVKKFLKGC